MINLLVVEFNLARQLIFNITGIRVALRFEILSRKTLLLQSLLL